MAETFHGYIETTQDVLLIFEGCRRGLIPRVCRRLQEKERRMIRSGSVFVFDERESGIKRWTDGLVWSPSRILGNFLIYRELDKRVPGDKKLSISSASSSNDARQRSYSADQSVITPSVSTDRNRERRLVGSLSDSYRFRKDGLIKKTMSIVVNGVHQHLISYYLPNDIIENKLRTPSSVPELASLEISPDLLVKQNFRIPPMVEPPFDQNDPALTMSSMDTTLTNSYSTDRRMHPFRSMSMGSLRTTNHYAPNPNTGRADMNNPLMYPTSTFPQRLDNTNNKLTYNTTTPTNTNNLSAYYGNQSMPMYNSNNNPTNNGFPPLPSPSSMTSAPNTPMLSPVRQSFPQQSQNRHYSISSTSSNSMRYNNNRASFDMETIENNNTNNTYRMQNSVHPHMMPEVNIYNNNNANTNNNNNNDSRLKTEISTTNANSNDFTPSPNIGQLLNPVHPLNTQIKQEQQQQQQQQFFMNSNNYADYNNNNTNNGNGGGGSGSNHNSRPGSFDGSKLPSVQENENTTNATTNSANNNSNFYGGNYYVQRTQQQQQPLTNTHSISVNHLNPMYQNGITFPQSSSSAKYDDSTDPVMEPFMLK